MITFNYPYWYIIFCILLGVGYAVLLYRKDKTFGEEFKFLPYLLGSLRFFSTTILALLLLEPLVQSEEKIIEKPIIVIAQDNSESIKLSKDSVFYKNDYKTNLLGLKNKLAEKFTIALLSFGDKVEDSLAFNYTNKQTDISTLFENIENKYYGRNLGGIIIASDGIINRGTNPTYAAGNLENTSIYTIAMGDTSIRRDLIVSSIFNNDIAYKGNDFPVEVSLIANYLKGQSALVSVWKRGKKIAEQSVDYSSDNESVNLNFILPASESGKQKYTVKVTELKEELTYLNNTKDFYINVIENKQNILILNEAPHPDIAVIKEVLLKNKNYGVEVKFVKDFKDKIEKYSLVILHGLPNLQQSNNVLVENLIKTKTPILICATEHTNYNKINQLKQKLSVIGANGYSSATGSLNQSFNKFTISNELRSDLGDYPPLQVPFAGGYKVAQSNNVLLHQKINGTITNYPLMVFNESNGQKIGFLLGEGIWRWKLLDYLKKSIK